MLISGEKLRLAVNKEMRGGGGLFFCLLTRRYLETIGISSEKCTHSRHSLPLAWIIFLRKASLKKSISNATSAIYTHNHWCTKSACQVRSYSPAPHFHLKGRLFLHHKIWQNNRHFTKCQLTRSRSLSLFRFLCCCCVVVEVAMAAACGSYGVTLPERDDDKLQFIRIVKFSVKHIFSVALLIFRIYILQSARFSLFRTNVMTLMLSLAPESTFKNLNKHF